MSSDKYIENTSQFYNFQLMAQSVVEGFMTGLHKSPFHGFSSEFSEHKIYNPGDSTKHIDWKLFAKTDKLYAKRYEEETNMRCHIILDQSSSMHYPDPKHRSNLKSNKFEFSVMASNVLLHILKKQRDAAGLSLYSDHYNFYAPEKGSERHFRLLFDTLNTAAKPPDSKAQTKTVEMLHQIAEKLHRRSMIFLFTDLFQTGIEQDQLFEALRHLKYNKHELVVFHVYDKTTELDFQFNNSPKRFVDVESGEFVDLYPETYQEVYHKAVAQYFDAIKLKCGQYKIHYVGVDIRQGFEKIMMTYFEKRHKFL